jgi:anhydro-N-acetylmuramic acid kinase
MKQRLSGARASVPCVALSEVPDLGAATLTMLTAATVARVVGLLPRAPKTWIVAGGGARNPTMMRMLTEKLSSATLETADQAG